MRVFDTWMAAVQAIEAGGAVVNRAASNLVNSRSAKHRASRVNRVAGSGGPAGVPVAAVWRDASPRAIGDRGQELSNTDPAPEEVRVPVGKEPYGAGAQLLRAADEGLGSVLDVTSGDR